MFCIILVNVKASIQSGLSEHASKDVPSAVSRELLAVAGYTSTPFILCQFDPNRSQG